MIDDRGVAYAQPGSDRYGAYVADPRDADRPSSHFAAAVEWPFGRYLS
jgi:hypothetical protein